MVAMLTNREVYGLISRHTTLTQKEVKECLDMYAKIVFQSTQNVDGGYLKIALPKIGYFEQKNRLGRKAGTYKIPLKTGGTTNIVLEEDEENYSLLNFHIYKTTQNEMKDATIGKGLNNG